MRVRLLGAAAGGGIPQWNCGCPNCRAVREGAFEPGARTQTSIAVSDDDGGRWFLIGASPDVRAQIEACPALHPRGSRDSPIAGVLLPNGDLDACLGLFSLRESQPLAVWATRRVRDGVVRGNTIARTLERFPGHTVWHTVAPGDAVTLPGTSLRVEVVPAPGKPPLHLAELPPSAEDNVGFVVRDGDRALGVFPSVAGPGGPLLEALGRCTTVLFDGTFWWSDELARLGLGEASAQAMGHWPLGGPEGSLTLLGRLGARRVLVHVNNTNPALDPRSPERRALEAAGVEVGADGMEIEP